nr:MAG TPA: hypothetical protein [Caudoviricetes sp.]
MRLSFIRFLVYICYLQNDKSDLPLCLIGYHIANIYQ